MITETNTRKTETINLLEIQWMNAGNSVIEWLDQVKHNTSLVKETELGFYLCLTVHLKHGISGITGTNKRLAQL